MLTAGQTELYSSWISQALQTDRTNYFFAVRFTVRGRVRARKRESKGVIYVLVEREECRINEILLYKIKDLKDGRKKVTIWKKRKLR